MKIFFGMLFSVLLGTFEVNVYATEQAQSTVKVAQRQCIGSNFSEFFEVFSEDVAVQKRFTKFPLRKMMLVDAEPEPKQQIRYISSDKISYPIIPPSEKRKKEGLTFKTENGDKRNKKVVLFKEDTGYQVVYFFKKSDCWNLVKIEDWSL